MRLLNTKTLEFKEFFDSNLPIYSILSHRWDDIEPSFRDFEASSEKTELLFEKIRRCCRFADQERGRLWVWIDTVCIDKSSSAEVSEAINSMYRWYKNAVECYTYLKDVKLPITGVQFRSSQWFTRGWTLQELLAPSQMLFVDREWNIIANKRILAKTIENITGIPELYVKSPEHLHTASVAMKMSWAAGRRTSRIEDRAYSLLGLFGVNMPLLYGEGQKAFQRLQLEILKISDDESIFAWTDAAHWVGSYGMLAATPDSFAASGGVTRLEALRPPYAMTHKGLKLRVPQQVVKDQTLIKFPLCCADKAMGSGEEELCLAITLQRVDADWNRVHCEELLCVSKRTLWLRDACLYPFKESIYVAQPDT